MYEYLEAVFSIQTECRTQDSAIITLKQLEVTASQVVRVPEAEMSMGVDLMLYFCCILPLKNKTELLMIIYR